jgi:homoserine kinase type II
MQDKIEQLVHYYFKDAPNYSAESVPFGLTNLTKIIKINERKFVIRIYNRFTKSIPSIELESKITSYLSHQNLSFQVPVFIHTENGDDYVQFPDGTLGAMVSFLEGHAPDLSEAHHADEFGRVVGEFTSALAKYTDKSLTYCGIPFSNIYSIHPLADIASVKSFFDKPPFHIPEGDIAFYREMILSVEKSMDMLEKLPKQFVHHDLLVFNLLTPDNEIRGILDFDFISYDVSFMEFAICLNHVLQMSDGSLEIAEAFIKGYAEHRQGSSPEFTHLQLLTRIYHIAVLHIYIGQQHSGVNVEQNFNYILNQFKTRDAWLNDYNSLLQRLLESYLL